MSGDERRQREARALRENLRRRRDQVEQRRLKADLPLATGATVAPTLSPATPVETMSEPTLPPHPTLDQIRALIPTLPGPDLAAGTAAVERQNQLTKPRGSLGRLEELAAWLATWQHSTVPHVDRPRVAVFAGNHGFAKHGVSAFPPEVTVQMVLNYQRGGAAINQLCRATNAELRIYELQLDQPTADFTEGPAMTDEECARALLYGMAAVEPGIDLLCIGEMGIGNTTAAAALGAALFGGDAAEWVGPGSGVDHEGLARKVSVVARGLAANREGLTEPFEILRRLGGFEIAAMTGAVLGARLARVPVVLDGYICSAAAAVLFKADRRALDHCIVSHRSAEPAHLRLVELFGQKPLLDLGMRLGEASGATMAIPVLKAAVACHNGMATFAEAGVTDEVK